MSFWELDNIRSVCGGTWLARPEEGKRPALLGVSIDSRTLKRGEVFIALRGERTDGHLYLRAAGAAGAGLAIIDRAEARPVDLPEAMSVLLVPDAGAALLKLGAAYRRTLESTKVVAVGGSNGKTTTTRLISAVLSGSLRGSASPKSFNNAIGVPLTILAAKPSDQYLICEVGTNAPGEIAPLTEAVKPDIAVITSLGREHLEGLGSLEGVAREESSLLRGVRPGGAAIVNADAPELLEAIKVDLARDAASGPAPTLVTFGFAEHADLRITEVEGGAEGTRFRLNARAWYRVPLLGRHNASNATAAIAVARRLGVDAEAIERGLAHATGAEMRLALERVGGVEFLNDAYNANPDSMLAALRVFDEAFPAGAGRRVLILGDMLELGAHSKGAHEEIGERVAAMAGVDLAVFVGPQSVHAAERVEAAWGSERVRRFGVLGDADVPLVTTLLRPGDRVLVKGSRGMGLERVIKQVRASDSAVGGAVVMPSSAAG